MLARGDDPAPGAVSGGESVDPRHAVTVPVLGLDECGDQLVEVGSAHGVDPHQRGGRPHQAQGCGEDDARQAHTAAGTPEELGVVRGRDRGDRTVRQGQLEALHVLTERAVPVVVLPVDVSRDGTADGDHPGSRGDGYEPAARDHEAQQRIQADSGLHSDQSGFKVEAQDLIEAGEVENQPARVLSRVAVRPAKTPRHQASAARRTDELDGLVRSTVAAVAAVRPQPVTSSDTVGRHHEGRQPDDPQHL